MRKRETKPDPQWVFADLSKSSKTLICLLHIGERLKGYAWRLLPYDMPSWQTVNYYFQIWNRDQTWLVINNQLCKWIRISELRLVSEII